MQGLVNRSTQFYMNEVTRIEPLSLNVELEFFRHNMGLVVPLNSLRRIRFENNLVINTISVPGTGIKVITDPFELEEEELTYATENCGDCFFTTKNGKYYLHNLDNLFTCVKIQSGVIELPKGYLEFNESGEVVGDFAVIFGWTGEPLINMVNIGKLMRILETKEETLVVGVSRYIKEQIFNPFPAEVPISCRNTHIFYPMRSALKMVKTSDINSFIPGMTGALMIDSDGNYQLSTRQEILSNKNHSL